MPKATAISINDHFAKLTVLENRTPHTTDEQYKDAFSTLSEYRDGGIFVTHYAGTSEWECHPNGDEIVMVMGGETTLILLIDDQEVRHRLNEGELLVVPQGVWHHFESPKGVKVLAVTPQPTEHSTTRPE